MRTTSSSTVFELRSLENEPLSKSYRNDDTPYLPARASFWRTPRLGSRFSGWRGGVVLALALAGFVLLLNSILAVVAATRWNPQDGIATAYTGNCTTAGRWTMVTHLLINLLSSLLLGASNYCMQRLVAPTRREIDIAHARKKWLDIGLPSLRNLSSISKSRVIIWVLLAMSSIPLHFLYNSVVFETIAANEVYFLQVHPAFFTDKQSWSYDASLDYPPTNESNATYPVLNSTWNNYVTRIQESLLDGKYLDPTQFENITSDECVSRYSSSFITSGNGFAVPVQSEQLEDNINATKSLSPWLPIDRESSITGLHHAEFAYCLSQKVPPKCQVQMSQTILFIVIACNIVKFGLMFIILWHMNYDTVVTVGDAIKSFLQIPDQTTENICLMSKRTVDQLWQGPKADSSQRFQPRRREPWYYACSKRRWWISYFLYFGAIATAATLLIVSHFKGGLAHNNFGTADTNSIIYIHLPYAATSILPHVLLANFPQVTVSFLYLTYNAIFTAMLANREWSRYAIKRAPLRVTIPSAGQRSTYFLQLPYTFSVPLLLASVLLHWFISQALFLVRIAVYGDGILNNIDDTRGLYQDLTKGPNGVLTGVGYSDQAIIASITWGCVLVATCLIVAWSCTYPTRMPLGGTISAVISAACHMKYAGSDGNMGEEMSGRRLKWGVTIEGSTEKVGHCCFSSEEVEEPTMGHLYAGLPER
ncbi:hypothetical protein BDV96DRAFT_137243 [Lophiotrema nucula]|uniref:DUF6536 domain-containing protein n=1 Tax=Lophiotrema nucula TaxID=690887 RepID=A0A6A5ZTE3_9PLEO|nr:hypothetical protein BDV96DRAFT_137243 [Lophiotrema nucula]